MACRGRYITVCLAPAAAGFRFNERRFPLAGLTLLTAELWSAHAGRWGRVISLHGCPQAIRMPLFSGIHQCQWRPQKRLIGRPAGAPEHLRVPHAAHQNQNPSPNFRNSTMLLNTMSIWELRNHMPWFLNLQLMSLIIWYAYINTGTVNIFCPTTILVECVRPIILS